MLRCKWKGKKINVTSLSGAIVLVILLIFMFVVTKPALALNYEEKPYFTAYIVGSNHVNKGETLTTTILLQNNARLIKVMYDDYLEYSFLSEKQDMLLTAYNVTINFESDEGIEIKSSEMKFTAIQPFKPIQLPIVIDISDTVKPGEHYITLDIKYEVFDDIFFERSSTNLPPFIPYQQIIEMNMTGRIEKITLINESASQFYTSYMKVKFKKEKQEIKLRLYVDKPDVKLDVINVEGELIAKGKGSITLTIKNNGEKTAKNLFVVMSSPSGFKISGMQVVNLEKYTKALSEIIGKSMFIPKVSITPPAELQTILSQGSYFIGDLRPGEEINVTFTVDVTTDEAGIYPFQIKGVYTSADKVKETNTVAFGVKVNPEISFNVIDVNSSVYAGSKGDVLIKVKADRLVNNLKATLEVNPPLTAIAGEAFAGNVNEAELRFKVKASSDAENTIYPAKLILSYTINGKEVKKEIDVGIEVKPKMRFEVIGRGVIEAGGERVVSVKVKNVGEFKIREASARITVVDPFSTTDDTSYIGDLNPGEAKNVSFRLKVDKDATPKLYALNLEVKYRDLNGEWVISEPTKMPIEVVESRRINSPGIIFAILAIIFAYWGMRNWK